MCVSTDQRRSDLRRGLFIEGVTIAWMVIEAAVALEVGVTARSGAALAFGLDSVIELASAGVLVWRLRAEFGEATEAEIEATERRAGRLVGGALLVLAGYVVLQSAATLLLGIRPEASLLGIGLAVAAVIAMPILARIKRNVATAIGSAALRGDAACSITCAYMAAALLVGLALNALFGWWWADPISALGIVYFLVREGRESWSGEECCDDCSVQEAQAEPIQAGIEHRSNEVDQDIGSGGERFTPSGKD
ncbi:MAG: cation transporter [Chloroflexi bacterium]|nr:cation transporter [Chloroflexota bacterium]